jgi:ADP-ribose pyrophosphatase
MSDLYSGHGWRVTLEKAALPDGKEKESVRIYRPDAVFIVAKKDAKNILLLREYRPFLNSYVWALPAGRIDKEADMLVAAHRELQEETGYKAAKMDFICSLYTTETISMQHHIFFADELTPSPLPKDEDEFIEVHECTPEEALKKIETSDWINGPSAYAIRRFLGENN